ncbi:CDP-alcohol phosphatidyltransferase family protein [Rhodoligotrophos defluvii]|uniref:CDP-alcohol phosphatidyltransferase family protein n=1 Tax=Rhodoligotrophos defluvii TaxID=2561934 RepID=UPI0010C97DFF|nr:CDP-alcohol phosphatidyltransferase family protein [Rhodoligotrophos defluvii]
MFSVGVLRSPSTATWLFIGSGLVTISLALLRQAQLAQMPSLAVSFGLFGLIVTVITLGVRRNGINVFGIANAITLMRAVLVSVLAGLACESLLAPGADGALLLLVLLIAIAALATDALDGWAARHSGTSSRFGARFDMEMDALLILILAILAWSFGQAGAWIIGAGLIYYLFRAAGWLWPVLAAPLPPSLRRKVVCVVQTVGLMVVLVVDPWLGHMVAAAALLALVLSFAIDIVWLVRHRPMQAMAP